MSLSVSSSPPLQSTSMPPPVPERNMPQRQNPFAVNSFPSTRTQQRITQAEAPFVSTNSMPGGAVVPVPWDSYIVNGSHQSCNYTQLPPPPSVIADNLFVGFTLSACGPVPIFFNDLQRFREHIQWLHGVLEMNRKQLDLYKIQRRFRTFDRAPIM